MVLYRRTLLLSLSAFLLLAGAGCRWGRADNNPPVAEQPAPVTTTAAGIPLVVKDESDKTKAIIEELIKQDADLDGLSDAEEKKNGTDLANSDTDHDGLLDKDEIGVYKSNPTKADSDGDGFSDGDEVRSGYSPTGPGKL